MEAKKEVTTHFIEKKGDKITIDLEVTGDPDAVIEKIMYSIRKESDIFDGAKVTQMFFKGQNIDTIVDNAKKKLIEQVLTSLNEIKNEI